jgi:hypothetical protein
MNEVELKAIWQKNENLSLENFDFESIKLMAIESQQKLRKRIKKEIIVGALLYLVLIPIFYFFPKTMFLIPIFIAVWVWYLWELKRIYRVNAEFQNLENLKLILQTKRQLLRGYFRRTRYVTALGMPILLILSFIILTSWELIIQNPMPFLKTLVFSQIAVIICVEFLLWLIYRPMLDETEDLLRQLDESQ